MTAPSTGYLPVARLLRPQGRRGELLAEPLSNLPELFKAGVCFRIENASHAPASGWILEEAWQPKGRNASRLVLKLAGVDDISAAEALAGCELLLAESGLPARDADTFLVQELVGCTLLDGDTLVGEIVDVQFVTTPDGRMRLEEAAPLLEVRPESSAAAEASHPEPFLVPFIKAWIERADLPHRTLRMRLPPGLLEP